MNLEYERRLYPAAQFEGKVKMSFRRGEPYLLAPGELELGPPEGLDDGILVLVVGAHGHERLPDPHAGDGALGLPEGAPHPRLGWFREENIDFIV